jgi:hypothetical protein
MTDDRRYHKEYCRDYCGYDKCPCVWLLGLGNFHQGTGFTGLRTTSICSYVANQFETLQKLQLK